MIYIYMIYIYVHILFLNLRIDMVIEQHSLPHRLPHFPASAVGEETSNQYDPVPKLTQDQTYKTPWLFLIRGCGTSFQ